jgi:ABC-type dipeptide/oligopeptide/nickel transport system permease component
MESIYTYKSSWWGFIGKHVLITMAVFVTISMVVYVAFHGFWGTDNAIHILNSIATYKELPEIDVLIDKYTSGEGRITQYFQWLGGFFTGDWGRSIIHEVPVKDLLC